ncbi:MAG TPA: sulfite exporter TauE/SafE family protein [Firmicutes bacterium]|nr:sulfite exporter TauE/SafE family protein [Bacillota bacterium]
MSAVFLINAGIVLLTAIFFIYYIRDLIDHKEDLRDGGTKSTVLLSICSNVILFFDTLGIGAYAPSTVCFKGFKLVPDRLIPGTLNAACAVSMAVESVVFITTVEVETVTLVTLIAASTVGAFLGAGFVSKLPLSKMQIGLGGALLIVAFTLIIGALGLMPVGGEAIALTGAKLVVSAIFCFIFGALMTIGVGAYALIMGLVCLMGLSPAAAFPITFGACAYLIPAASIRFVRETRKNEKMGNARPVYHRKAVLIYSTIGLIGPLVACFLITSLPLNVLKWLVAAVVTYTAITMLRGGLKNRANPDQEIDENGEPVAS